MRFTESEIIKMINIFEQNSANDIATLVTNLANVDNIHYNFRTGDIGISPLKRTNIFTKLKNSFCT